MNGGYINPPAIKRSLRDPYADWWDKQERRNYGEPVHEDNDILGVFSLEEYNHVKPGKGALQIGAFVACVLTLCGVTSYLYPDKPAVPREYPDGLDRELGGKGAVRAHKPGDEYFK
ncbi:MAG: swr1 complex component [Chaenotheca gracillima]|nr:MAG: swr1 complex component [Chaenotheca gracillima]